MPYILFVNQDEILWQARRILRGKEVKDINTLMRQLGLEGIPESEKKMWKLLLECVSATFRHELPKLIRISKSIISLSPERWFKKQAYYYLGWALVHMGDFTGAEESLYMAWKMGARNSVHNQMAWLHISTENYAAALKVLEKISEDNLQGLQIRLIPQIMLGELKSVRHEIEKLLEKLFTVIEDRPVLTAGTQEIYGIVLRSSGDFRKAAKAFDASAKSLVDLENAYALFPLIKHKDMSIMAGVPDPDPRLVKKALGLCSKGGPAEMAAKMEWRALELWEAGNLKEACALSLEAARTLSSVGQPAEAFWGHIRVAFIAYKAQSDMFFKALDYIRPRIGLYPYIFNDALWSDFMQILKPMLDPGNQTEPEVKIHLFENGSRGPCEPKGWPSRKALLLLKYLLLNQGKSMAAEYLAYLLWPKEKEDKALQRLYIQIHYIRKKLGSLRDALVYSNGTYAMREDPRIWVDVAQFQHLLREAEALSQNPELQLKKYLQALQLYTGPLLPEDRYDRHIEEHRNYLHKKFQRALVKAVELLLGMEEYDKALNLAESFYLKFPRDDTVAKTYIQLLLKTDRISEAERVFDEFKRRLWREHKTKPSFNLPNK